MTVETTDWIDADGAAYSLDTGGVKVLQGVEGRYMPPVDHVEQEVPLQPGARLRRVKTKVREVTLPVAFTAADESGLRTMLRTWAYRLLPDRGDGQLRVMAPGGGQRVLFCRYSDGLEIVQDPGNATRRLQKAVLVFRAHDPYWQDAADTTLTFTSEDHDSSGSFFPFFPLTLLASESFVTVTITNGGDVSAWPVWRITGPAANPVVLRNTTTGKRLEVARDVGTGEVITIDTRPGVKTVRLNDDTNLYGDLSVDSALWELVRGGNVVAVEFAGATDATRVDLSYRQRYLTV